MSESTALTVYERMPDQLEAIKVLGTAIAKSGLFNCSSVEMGMVFATECMFRNLPPLSLAQKYHVIFGKLSMKAEAMLDGFEAIGGKHVKLSRTPELASIEFTLPNGRTEVLSLSWEEAQKEPFPYEGKEEAIVDLLLAGKKPKLKPKYATPRSRMQMLWARLVSDSVRFLCPKVVCGVYTPEESEDIAEAEGKAKSSGNGHASATVVESTASPAAPVAVVKVSPDKPGAETIDVPFETKETAKSADAGMASAEARQQIESLFLQLGMTPAQQQAALEKRAVNSLRSLTAEQAAELAGRLTAARDKQKQQADAALPAIETGNEPVTASCGPCTLEQEQRIKVKLQEWAQVDPKTYAEQMTPFKKKLIDSGRQKILDLSANDAARLYDLIQVRNLASFCQLALETWKPKELPPPPAEEPSKFVQSLAEMQGQRQPAATAAA